MLDQHRLRRLARSLEELHGIVQEILATDRRERQLEGIDAAKARGVYKGRKPSIDVAEIVRLRRVENLGPTEIARQLGIGRASVYRLLKQEGGSRFA